MKTRNLLGPKVSLALQLAAVTMSAFSAYFFLRLDQVVHGDLYRYGLQFDYEWATPYWTYSKLLTGFLGVAVIVTGISIAFTLIYTRAHGVSSKLISCLLLIVGIVLTGSCAFFFNHLDYIVHHDLYRFGLQFDYEWAVRYWMYARLVLGLLGLSAATSIVSISSVLATPSAPKTQLFHRARPVLKISTTKLVISSLLSIGAIAFAFSINYSSSILAFIGLGLVLWSIILFYVRPEKYIKRTLLDSTTLPLLENLEKIMNEFGTQNRGVYLPQKYLKSVDSSAVYVPLKAEKTLPRMEEVDEEKLCSKNPEGVFLTPPGLALSRLFEKELGTSFTRTDLNYIQEKLPKLFIENLEIAENMEITTEDSVTKIEITNHIFNEICRETQKLYKIHESMGCPMCSAIACALAKATGKPIRIEREEQSQDGKTTRVYYSILKD